MTERERLEAYVQWNQLTRHQIITAHLTLIDVVEHAQKIRRDDGTWEMARLNISKIKGAT